MEFSDYDFMNNYESIKKRQRQKTLCQKINDGCYTLFWISPLGSWIDNRRHENATHLLSVAIHLNAGTPR